MVFFTSNLGYSDAQQRSAPIGYLDDEARVEASDTDVRREIRRRLTPEFVNRVRMIHFNRLTLGSAERILELELRKITNRYQEVHGLEIQVDASAREELIRCGFSSSFGARHLAATLESVCNVEIAKRIHGEQVHLDADREEVVSWLREIRDGSRAFDANEVRARVLDVTRARLSYDALMVGFSDGEFSYTPRADGETG